MTTVFSTFFSKARKIENIKYVIPNGSPVESLLFEYWFWEIVPYSSQDTIYTTRVTSVIFSLLSFLPDVNLQCSKHASPRAWRAGHLSFVWWEPELWEMRKILEKTRIFVGNRISSPLSLAPFFGYLLILKED